MAKELTLRDVCLEQMQRLNKTLGYPDNKLAMNDYCAALEVMETFEGVRALVDDLTRTDLIRMPTAAGIRSMAYERMRDALVKRRECTICDGSGMQTVWKLVTYEGNSFIVKHAQTIPEITSDGQAGEYTRRLQVWMADNPGCERQTVLSAAKECQCRKAKVLQ